MHNEVLLMQHVIHTVEELVTVPSRSQKDNALMIQERVPAAPSDSLFSRHRSVDSLPPFEFEENVMAGPLVDLVIQLCGARFVFSKHPINGGVSCATVFE